MSGQRLQSKRLLDQLRRIQLQTMLEQDAQHADGSAAQPERIARAAGLLTDGEDARERIELVGQRKRIAEGRRRQGIAGCTRQVLLREGLGHGGRLAIGKGVVAAHGALQIRKFSRPSPSADRIWPVVRRARGVAIGTDVGGDRASQSAEALGARAERAELSLEGHRIEPGAAMLQRLPAILLPEEAASARRASHHALVSGSHGLRVATSMLLTVTKHGQQGCTARSRARSSADAPARWRAAPRAATPGSAARSRPASATGHSTSAVTSSSRRLGKDRASAEPLGLCLDLCTHAGAPRR